MSYLDHEQIRADIGRWKREIQNERAQRRLPDDHPNISKRLDRIRAAEELLKRDVTPIPAEACQRREPHECGDDVEYCERCGGYRPDPHRCDTGSSTSPDSAP